MADEFGFTAVVRSQKKLLDGHKKESPYIDIEEFPVPDTAVVQAVEEYVKTELSPETYRHSVRAFYYGNGYPLLSINCQAKQL
jgi:cyanamide hydratase